MSNSALFHAFLVGAGGFLGAIARYGVHALAARQAPHAVFPIGTVGVNLFGCLAIGLLAGLTDSRQVLGPEARAFAIVGLLGGFTTFSTFGYDTLILLRNDELAGALASVGIQVVLGVVLVWIGYALTSK